MLKITRYALGCIILALAAHGNGVSAQTYMGDDAFDGTHKNEVTGYMSLGSNIITGFFMGPAVEYKRHFTPRWSAMGASEY